MYITGADPGGWIGCLVTPLWVKLSTRTMKIGNHAKQRTVRHVQCARCLSSERGNPDGKLIVKLSFYTLCGRGHIPLPCSPPQYYVGNVVQVFTQSPPLQIFWISHCIRYSIVPYSVV